MSVAMGRVAGQVVGGREHDDVVEDVAVAAPEVEVCVARHRQAVGLGVQRGEVGIRTIHHRCADALAVGRGEAAGGPDLDRARAHRGRDQPGCARCFDSYDIEGRMPEQSRVISTAYWL
jgi:hypothetical protein